MEIITNQSGTRRIAITQANLDTIEKYQLFRNLVDSNGIVDETVLDKLRLNVRALLEAQGMADKNLTDLCFDVIYHSNMKAIGLHNLVLLYLEKKAEQSAEPTESSEGQPLPTSPRGGED